jgi:hypothetical protein
MASKLSAIALAAALGGFVVPALAQNDSSGPQQDHGMSMGHRGQGMRGMMSRGMMGGCSEMMQSMNNGGDGRPNSQWQKSSPHSPNNGG